MFLRKIFEEFLVLHTEAEPVPAADERPLHEPPRTWSLDWRWLETAEDAA